MDVAQERFGLVGERQQAGHLLSPRDPLEIDLNNLALPPVSSGDREVVGLGEHLAGKHIALVVSGTIASYKAPEIVRTLRRYGADVTVYMTEDAAKMVTTSALQWAVGVRGKVIENDLTGAVEHLGQENGKRYDAYVVCPATYNTINKMAQGVADSAATTLLAAARGRLERERVPVIIVPTMNGDMVNSRLLNSLSELRASGAYIMKPRTENGKFELPDHTTVAICVCRQLSQSCLAGRPVLLTAGPTPVPLDKVRIIANIFKGTLGVYVARELIARGVDLRLLLGGSSTPLPDFVRAFTRTHSTFDEYRSNVLDEVENGYRCGSRPGRPYEGGIFSAAVADYRPVSTYDGKISSGTDGLTLPPFVPTQKIIKEVRALKPNLPMITFKLLVGVTEEALLEVAKSRLKDYEVVVANRLEDLKLHAEDHNAWIVHRSGIERFTGTKSGLARRIVTWLESYMQEH